MAVDDSTLDDWAARISTASTWVSGSQGRKLQALSEEITAAKHTAAAPTPPAGGGQRPPGSLATDAGSTHNAG